MWSLQGWSSAGAKAERSMHVAEGRHVAVACRLYASIGGGYDGGGPRRAALA